MTAATNMTVKVANKFNETADISTFELVACDGSDLPAFAAGAHIDVQLPGGIIRQYSLCNNPAETHRYLIGVLKDPNSRGGSVAIHEKVNQGDELLISLPKNHFPIDGRAQHHLILGGGIGVTPIICMAEQLSSQKQSFEMHYCSRAPELTAFKSRIADSDFAESVQHHFDSGDAAQLLDIPALLATPVQGTHVYVCGPKGFMDAVLSTARNAGWPEEQLHYEFFSADVGPSDTDTDFDVVIQSTGQVIPVDKEKSVVDTLAEHGIELPVSCEQGVCGTCLTNIIEGEPDHKDMYLTPDEQESNKMFMPCCSRAKSNRLVLDL